ncbi:MAG: tetratricopeptide repeat protein [Verrucomicrobia bacterium]|nr:tetratricopeptide repeat protein [Verrucomicrobiota bacterium]
MTNLRSVRSPLTAAALLVALIFSLTPSLSLAADELDSELTFISGLLELGFSDFAEDLADQLERRYPAAKDRVQIARTEILISKRKFAEAEQIIKSLPSGSAKAQAMTLALANGYFRTGEQDKAKAVYQGFFDQYKSGTPKDPDLLRFYQNAAYTYGQMLKATGDLADTVKAYDLLLDSKPEKGIARRLMSEQAELYVKLGEEKSGKEREDALAKARKICGDIQWGGYDIWFGQSVITMAHIELVRGDRDKAQKLLNDYKKDLKEIDKFLKEAGESLAVSPMAGARFLLGTLYHEDGTALAGKKDKREQAIDKLGKAIREFYTVFVTYEESEWASDAGLKIKQIEEQLAALGKTVKVDLGDRKLGTQASFKTADNFYARKQYDEAINAYLGSLNQFPEGEYSHVAVSKLMQCYIEKDDKLYIEMLADYLAERFSAVPEAALGLLRAGKSYFDKKDREMYEYLYSAYLRGFPKDERAAAIHYTLASMKKQAGETEAAMKDFADIVRLYPKDKNALRALNQVGRYHYDRGEFAQAIELYEKYVKESTPSYERAMAQMTIANAYKELKDYVAALKAYGDLVGWLAKTDDNPYRRTEDPKQPAELLERAVFFRGVCYASMTEPEDKIPEYRERALKAYEQFVALFPSSDLAATAMSLKGAVQLELGQFDEAAKTYDELSAKYPESPEGKNALYSLVSSAIQVKQYDQARKAFGQMMSSKEIYTPEQFVRIGKLMLDARFYPEAKQAYAQIPWDTEDRAVIERALYGLGKADFMSGDFEGAIKPLEELMDKYPNSALFYDAKFTLGGAYRKVERYDDAVGALRDVFKYAKDNVLRTEADYALYEVQRARGDLDAALASVMRISLLADASNKDLRPIVNEAIQKGIEVAGELERWNDVVDLCDQFLKEFSKSEKIEEMRRIRASAKLKASALSAGPAGEPAPN